MKFNNCSIPEEVSKLLHEISVEVLFGAINFTADTQMGGEVVVSISKGLD